MLGFYGSTTFKPRVKEMTREIVSTSPHREVGIINAGWLLSHPVHHESHLERRFVMAALACPVVTDIVHQPETITLESPAGGDCKKYTPDYQLTLLDGTQVIVEVKPEAFLKKHALTLEAAKQHFEKAGKQYIVVTDKHIDQTQLGQRAILLMRYARIAFTTEQAQECIALIESMANRQASVRELIDQGLNEVLLWSMVGRHKLAVPPPLDMGPETKLTTQQNKENSHDQLLAWFGFATR
jgi:hypothetical protein